LYLIQSKRLVSMDAKHFPKAIFVGLGVRVSVQEVLDHFQKCWVVFFRLNFTCEQKLKLWVCKNQHKVNVHIRKYEKVTVIFCLNI
jgi:hypothetical protein